MVQFFDFKKIYDTYCREGFEKAFKTCLDHGHFINGPEVKKFEGELAEKFKVSDAVGVSSGTDALLAVFMALKEFTTPERDEVLVTPFTFVASATSILRAGLKPVFVDIRDASSKNEFMPSLEDYRSKWTNKTCGVLVVHLFGEASRDMVEIDQECKRRNAWMVEDCAQAFGTGYRHDPDRLVGTMGVASAFSFFPAKNLGCLGDGGAILTSDPKLASTLRQLRNHGGLIKYQNEILGGNFRLDTLQAAMLLEMLPFADEWIMARRNNAKFYSENLRDCKNFQVPHATTGHSYNQYTLYCNIINNEMVVNMFKEKGLSTMVYYPRLLSEQGVMREANVAARCDGAKTLCYGVFSIPVGPHLTQEDLSEVIRIVKEVDQEITVHYRRNTTSC